MERINGQVKDEEELAKQVLLWITVGRNKLVLMQLGFWGTHEHPPDRVTISDLPMQKHTIAQGCLRLGERNLINFLNFLILLQAGNGFKKKRLALGEERGAVCCEGFPNVRDRALEIEG